MASKIYVAPSLLSANPLNFGAELADIEAAGADWHHVDVMDGHFVPNLTYGIPFVRALKKQMKKPLDVHIMITNPDEMALEYVNAGADVLTFHVEAALHPHRLIRSIQSTGAKAGIAINPATPTSSIKEILRYIDLVNVMSVNPGFGGQSFIPEILPKIEEIANLLEQYSRRNEVFLEVDGGINGETGAQVIAAGANFLVAGNYVYNAPSRKEAISTLKNLK